MEELISVIVPVYKVEKYLDKCVQSIVNQSYKNIEIILVDDGSPDQCPYICDEWAKKDFRIRVLHQKNAGLSAARNAGMTVAKGEYIGFVDSDDYIECDMYEKLYEAITSERADLAICGFDIVTEAGEIIECSAVIKNEIFSGKTGLKKLIQPDGYHYVVAWNKLYSKKVMNGLIFPEGKIHEDEFIVHHIFGKCSKIVSVDEGLYKYVKRPGSIISSPNLIKGLDAIEALCDRIVFYDEYNMQNESTKLLTRIKYVYISKRVQLYGRYQWKNRCRVKEVDRLFCKIYFSKKKNISVKEKMILRFPTIMILYMKMCEKNKYMQRD